jgi:hypothetical protein
MAATADEKLAAGAPRRSRSQGSFLATEPAARICKELRSGYCHRDPYGGAAALPPQATNRALLGGALFVFSCQLPMVLQTGTAAEHTAGALPRHRRRRSLLARLDRIEQRLEAMHRGDQEALVEALTTLEKQVVRAGRAQFKASTLAEAQRDELRAVMETLRAGESQREATLERI